MERRQALQTLGAAVLGWPLAAQCVQARSAGSRKILFFSRSVLFEHSVVHREGDELSFGERTFTRLARQLDCEVECTKDGRVFDGDLSRYAAVVSYTCGSPDDLMKPESLDHSPAVTQTGWKQLDAAVRGGLPFVAIHPGAWLLPEACGAECLGHGLQQAARIQVVSPRFPGAETLGDAFTMVEEWFSLVRFVDDLHVILVQDCTGMSIAAEIDRRCYDRPPFPATWARMHGQGRVFYTSLGHREDVWGSEIFAQVVSGGLSWALGRLDADITPNITQVAPQANQFPRT
ncbi:MAG: ThuA domain-containing protein [Planctomycetaceae bacterium]|nr:ThuA domain-containing protein [Planctomycetaceae bacterium]